MKTGGEGKTIEIDDVELSESPEIPPGAAWAEGAQSESPEPH